MPRFYPTPANPRLDLARQAMGLAGRRFAAPGPAYPPQRSFTTVRAPRPGLAGIPAPTRSFNAGLLGTVGVLRAYHPQTQKEKDFTLYAMKDPNGFFLVNSPLYIITTRGYLEATPETARLLVPVTFDDPAADGEIKQLPLGMLPGYLRGAGWCQGRVSPNRIGIVPPLDEKELAAWQELQGAQSKTFLIAAASVAATALTIAYPPAGVAAGAVVGGVAVEGVPPAKSDKVKQIAEAAYANYKLVNAANDELGKLFDQVVFHAAVRCYSEALLTYRMMSAAFIGGDSSCKLQPVLRDEWVLAEVAIQVGALCNTSMTNTQVRSWVNWVNKQYGDLSALLTQYHLRLKVFGFDFTKMLKEDPQHVLGSDLLAFFQNTAARAVEVAQGGGDPGPIWVEAVNVLRPYFWWADRTLAAKEPRTQLYAMDAKGASVSRTTDPQTGDWVLTCDATNVVLERGTKGQAPSFPAAYPSESGKPTTSKVYCSAPTAGTDNSAKWIALAVAAALVL